MRLSVPGRLEVLYEINDHSGKVGFVVIIIPNFNGKTRAKRGEVTLPGTWGWRLRSWDSRAGIPPSGNSGPKPVSSESRLVGV